MNQITPKDFLQRKSEGKKDINIDVRSLEMYMAGHIEGALSLPKAEIDEIINSSAPDKIRALEEKCGIKFSDYDLIIVNCLKGINGGITVDNLSKLGIKNAVNLEGGYENFVECGNTRPPAGSPKPAGATPSP